MIQMKMDRKVLGGWVTFHCDKFTSAATSTINLVSEKGIRETRFPPVDFTWRTMSLQFIRQAWSFNRL